MIISTRAKVIICLIVSALFLGLIWNIQQPLPVADVPQSATR